MSLGFCLCVSSGFKQLFSRWKERRPFLLSAMFLLLLLHAGKTWDQNKIWLSRETLFKLNSEYLSAHNNLGTILDNETEAEGHFRAVLEIAPSHPGAHVNLGNILFKHGNLEEGLRLLYKALEIDSSYLDALLSLSNIFIQLENFVEAEKYLQRAEDISPGSIEVYTRFGALMSKKGDSERAIFYYKKVLNLDQHHSEAMVNAAAAYKQLGNTGQAEHLLKQAVAIRRDMNSLEQLATFFYHSGRVQESLRLYEEIDTIAPNTTDMLVRYVMMTCMRAQRSLNFCQIRQLTAELAALERLKNPHRLIMGKIGVATFSRLFLIGSISYLQGNVLGSLNKLDKAESVFLRVLRQDQQNIDALLGLSILQSRQAKYHQSIEYLSSAIEISEIGGNTERLKQLYFERGNNYKDLNLLSEALEDYRKTLELDNSHVKAHGNLGTIYHIWGDLEKAKDNYEAALKIDPNNSIVRENLEKLNKIRP